MPSASAKLVKCGSQESLDPLQKALNLIEKKSRNLEKRKNKLEQYRSDLDNGKTLNTDQLHAVEAYDSVISSLELTREFTSQINGIIAENNKLQKKALRKEHQERANEDLEKVKEILRIQDVLQLMGQDSAREDFVEGKNGAIKLHSEQLDMLDQIYKQVTPSRENCESNEALQENVHTAADHLLGLVEGRSKPFVLSTYQELRNLFHQISSCSYPHPPKSTESEEVTNSNGVNEVSSEDPVPEEELQGDADADAEAEAEGVPSPSLEQPPAEPPSEVVQPTGYQDVVAPSVAPEVKVEHPPFFAPSAATPQSISLSDVVPPGKFSFFQESQIAQEAPVFLDPAVMSVGSIKPKELVHIHEHPSGIPTQTFTNSTFAPPVTQFTQAISEGMPNPPPPIPMPHETQEQTFSAPAPEVQGWDAQPPTSTAGAQNSSDESQWTIPDATVNGDASSNEWTATEQMSWNDFEEQPGGAASNAVSQQDGGDRKPAPRGGRGARGANSRGGGGSRGRGSQNFGYNNRGGYRGGGGRGGNLQATGAGGNFRGSRSGFRGGPGKDASYRGNRGRGSYQGPRYQSSQ